MNELPEEYRTPVQARCPKGKVRIAFVGGSPDWKAAHNLTPFYGEGLRILNACSRLANINLGECYVGNYFDTMLYQDDVASHGKAVGLEALEELRTAAHYRFAAEMGACTPDVVVALGPVALGALCGLTQVQKFRGSARLGAGAFSTLKVFPTYHPMHISRNYKLLTTAIGDYIRLHEDAITNGPRIVYPERELIVQPTIQDVRDYAAEVRGAALLSCDIETTMGQVRGISFAASRNKGIYVPFVSFGSISGSYWYSADLEREAWLLCKEILESPVPKLGQNFGNYDCVWLLQAMGIRVRNYSHDLRLLHKALYPELPASLEFMANSYSEQGAWKSFADHAGIRQADEQKRDA